MTAANEPPHHEGALGVLNELGHRLIGTLPPAFLMLCVLNIVFLGVMMWFINGAQTQRVALVQQLLDRCMSIALQAPPPK